MLAEGLVGYPDAVFRRVGHPVSWAGWLIDQLDRRWNDPACSDVRRRLRGAGAIGCVVAAAAVGGRAVSGSVAGQVVVVASLMAARGLHRHVRAVEVGLGSGLAEGRAAVGRIVGRDVEALDEAGVARAAIESLAENFSDGVVAPALFLLIGGVPGMAIYKAVNTADSMIGHRSERHLAFGWASARLDDVLNLPASRVSALLIALASGRPMACLRAVGRDAGRHRSPNAGWPEAAMAGALGVRLAGPRVYGGVRVPDAWMGDGGVAGAEDIGRALAVYGRACGLLWLVAAGAAALRGSGRR